MATMWVSVLAGTPWLMLAMAASMLVGMGITSVNVSTNAVLQSLSPDHIRGRVISLFTAFRFGMDALGGLLAGWLTHQFGAQSVLGGEAVLVAVGAFWMLSQSRRVRAAASEGELSKAAIE
jgi:MFS family permease